MTRFLITFGAHAMDGFSEDEMTAVACAAHSVTQEMIDAGVLVLAGGLEDRPATIVAVDGGTVPGTLPDVVGGVTVVDVPTADDAFVWASRIARACRCAQEVRAFGDDPELEAMLERAHE